MSREFRNAGYQSGSHARHPPLSLRVRILGSVLNRRAPPSPPSFAPFRFAPFRFALFCFAPVLLTLSCTFSFARAAQFGFFCESVAADSKRWMHQLGVAFVQLDPRGRGFLWSFNRLLPSQAARMLSDRLLAAFRDVCEALEIEATHE
eukprot:4166898-Pleurochrysis_carterae.AAC.1